MDQAGGSGTVPKCRSGIPTRTVLTEVARKLQRHIDEELSKSNKENRSGLPMPSPNFKQWDTKFPTRMVLNEAPHMVQQRQPTWWQGDVEKQQLQHQYGECSKNIAKGGEGPSGLQKKKMKMEEDDDSSSS